MKVMWMCTFPELEFQAKKICWAKKKFWGVIFRWVLSNLSDKCLFLRKNFFDHSITFPVLHTFWINLPLCGAPGVRPMTPTHSTRIDPWPKWAGVPFMKKVHIPKFWSPGRPARPFGPIFSSRGPKFKIMLPTFFCLVVWIPKRYDTTPSLQNPGRR